MPLRWPKVLVAMVITLLLSGCAVISVKRDDERRGMTDAAQESLGRDGLSVDTRAALSTIGRRPKQCRVEPDICAAAFSEVASIAGDQAQASLAELYLAHAIDTHCSGTDGTCQDRRAADLIESARRAYLYLFFGERPPKQRVFERRQVEVRAFYNRAVQELVVLLHERYRSGVASSTGVILRDGIQLNMQPQRDMLATPPLELVPASGLGFNGLRNSYQRDGFGAEFVAVYPPETTTEVPFQQLNYKPVTMALSFDGEDATQVHAARAVTLELFDPYQSKQIRLGGRDVPLSVNFSAAYGLWLARTNLIKLGMSGLVGRGEADRDAPRVIMLEPYDPNRQVLILIHGLASSQEAWINVANEVMGDPILRERLQIWQVVYPTRMPLLISAARIENALCTTFDHFDPGDATPASHNAVLVGHSMGGVISRLLITPSDPALLNRLLPPGLELDAKRRAELAEQPGISELMQLSPLSQVKRVVFIATPHRGTPLAERRIALLARRLVRLPLDAVKSFQTALTLTGANKQQLKQLGLRRPQSGVDELAENSRFMLATRDMPVEAGLPFHSIIGRSNPKIPLEQSSDGFVPYTSSHLLGAVSEAVITSGHSVQETPEAILELRRILHEHIDADAHPQDTVLQQLQ